MHADRIRVLDLKADYLDCPLGLDNSSPHLSWRIESEARNVSQTAYRIWVATSADRLEAGEGDLWDSGRVSSRSSLGIPYAGLPLQSRQRCWWRVQIWDETGAPSAPSPITWWEMGLLNPDDWTAGWLNAETHASQTDRETRLQWIWGDSGRANVAQQFRSSFTLDEPSASGKFFAFVNNFVVSPRITGIWIDGERYDISDQEIVLGRWLDLAPLRAGRHTIAVETFVDTWSEQDALTFLARLVLESGRILRIGSGPETKSAVTGDAEWFALDYDDRHWSAAKSLEKIDFQPWPALPALYLRRTFSLKPGILSARLYATALGAYEAHINGRRVGDALLTPEPSQYAEHVLYRSYDVTDMLQAGENALGLLVGDGWYGGFDGRFAFAPAPLRVRAQLEVCFDDGRREIVGTDNAWRIVESPVLYAEIRRGEYHDARLAQPGWDAPGFDDRHWSNAVRGENPPCRLAAHTHPPVRAMETLQPQAVIALDAESRLVDFGRCLAGWCRLRVRGTRGARIELEFAEVLTPSGELETGWLAMGELKKDVYVLRGDPAGETFEPYFTYRGFRYVQIHGLSHEVTLESIEGIFAHTDLPITGRLRFGSPLIQRIQTAIGISQKSNFVGIPTDCPSREQRGWLGDAGVFWDAAAFNMDVAAFTIRQMDNIVDDLTEDGMFPILSPLTRDNGSDPGPTWRDPAPAWSDAGVILPLVAWRHYGDTRIIDRYWKVMDRYVQAILDRNSDGIWRHRRGADFGDWYAPAQRTLNPQSNPSAPFDLIATAYWAYSTSALLEMAEATGRTSDVQRLRELVERIRKAFAREFIRSDGSVGNDSQTSYVLALQFGLVPDELRQTVAERLAANVRAHGIALTTGILGTRFILDVLADAGFADLAYGLLLREAFPSWGYMLNNGGTAMWETWTGDLDYPEGPRKFSQNHFMFGSISAFLYQRVAGIDAREPGFQTIAIRPIPDARVRSAGADYDSAIGRISTDWKLEDDGTFSLDVVIPANATAHVYLPASQNANISESGIRLEQSTLRMLQRSHEEAVVEIGSGRYRFAVTR